jgi:hypothetical protein
MQDRSVEAAAIHKPISDKQAQQELWQAKQWKILRQTTCGPGDFTPFLPCF